MTDLPSRVRAKSLRNSASASSAALYEPGAAHLSVCVALGCGRRMVTSRAGGRLDTAVSAGQRVAEVVDGPLKPLFQLNDRLPPK